MRKNFYRKYNFPGIVGCIDCTHVAIKAPTEDEHIYFNARKRYHSLNVQLVCDPELKILNVNARFPGSVNDTFIWNSSHLKEFLVNLNRNDPGSYFLLGDSGYPLRAYMQTPIMHPEPAPNSPAARYNLAQRTTRSIIERCNGLLKSRLRCLLKMRALHYAPEVAAKIVNACVLLHNMCIIHNIAPPDPEADDDLLDFGILPPLEEDINNIPAGRINPELELGRRVQQRIIQTFFN